MQLIDRYRRRIDYLRFSVTDRCNLRCIYCMPHNIRPVEYKSILTYEEILRIVKVCADIGVRRIRLTGGEPLARKNIQYLVSGISRINGIQEISLTTNGTLLYKYVEQLKEAGLSRVNISLDSLNPDKYRKITGGGDIGIVFRGIERAEKLGLVPIRLNVVIIRGVNDDEIEEFALLTKRTPYHVRFIEFMPGRGNNWTAERCVTTREIQETLQSRLGELQPVDYTAGGPARYFKLPEGQGLIGFISPISDHFCGDCNRLRITADGKVRPCLFSETEIDLKRPLRSGASDEELQRLIKLAVQAKPEGHQMYQGSHKEIPTSMSKIGG